MTYMQRVFDALRATPGRSIAELATELGLGQQTIRDTLTRLKQLHMLEDAACVERVWRYSLKPHALRPGQRGRPRKERHEHRA